MTYSIPISEAMRAALSDHTRRYIKVTITHDGSPIVFHPTRITGTASEEFQSWNVQLKNYGEYSEGLFADDLATVAFSHNNSDWITLMTGYVSPEGMNREQGYVSDDIVSFDLVDRTKGKGTKRKPSSAVFAALKICDPSDASNSILHRLGSLMGITSFDAGLIQDVKDIVVLGEQVVWSELKLLSDAYKACLYFDYLGRLRFHSPLEIGWTDPVSEWTFVADPSHPLDSYSSRVVGKVRRTYNQVRCNRATSNLNLYEQRSLRVVYRDTTNWNGDLSQCSIVIQPGATYPESGVLSLNYKDPLTSEEYPYATNILTPTIGQTKTFDICYSGGHLELISFNGSTSATTQQPGASQIILKNTGSLACEIIKFEVRGEPFFQLSENKVEEVDSSISDEVDYVDLSVDGKYATSVEQIDKVLSRNVEEGKIRTRHFSFASIFLPQIQREMVCTFIDVDGSEVACKVTTYSHKASGKTLDTMKTYLELDEVLSYIPTYNPRHEVTPPNVMPPQRGADGASAKAVIILCDSDGLPVTSRGVPKIASIRFTLSLQNLTINEASDVAWVCSDPEVTLAAVPGDIYSVDLDTSEVSVDSFTVTATVSGIMGLVGISKRADGKPAPHSFGGVASVPTQTPTGEPLVAGDYFLWSAATAGEFSKGQIYEYNGTSWVMSTNGNLVFTIFDAVADLANDVEETTIGNAVIKRLTTLEAMIRYLIVRNARSDNYTEDANGVPLTGWMLDGPTDMMKSRKARFYEAHIFNAILENATMNEGSFLSDEFSTQKADGEGASFNTTISTSNYTLSMARTFFEAIFEMDVPMTRVDAWDVYTISGNYKGTSFSSVKRNIYRSRAMDAYFSARIVSGALEIYERTTSVPRGYGNDLVSIYDTCYATYNSLYVEDIPAFTSFDTLFGILSANVPLNTPCNFTGTATFVVARRDTTYGGDIIYYGPYSISATNGKIVITSTTISLYNSSNALIGTVSSADMLMDGTSVIITVESAIQGIKTMNIVPVETNSYDLGSSNKTFKRIFLGGSEGFLCRAWVNFNGTGTVAIRASKNISSVVDIGTGSYTINFENAMPDTNYIMVAPGLGSASQSYNWVAKDNDGNALFGKTVSSHKIVVSNASNGGAVDAAHVYIAWFR